MTGLRPDRSPRKRQQPRPTQDELLALWADADEYAKEVPAHMYRAITKMPEFTSETAASAVSTGFMSRKAIPAGSSNAASTCKWVINRRG